jgi:hypothetical protein
MTDLAIFGSKTHAQQERANPHCPKCHRAYAEKTFRPKEQTPTYRCVGVPSNPGCGNVFKGPK